jgi:hypothetical protein
MLKKIAVAAPLATAILACAVPLPTRAEVVDYEVRELSNTGFRVVAKGRRDYSPSDIKVFPYERNGRHIAEKLLELEQGFKIGARIFSDDGELKGFGLIARQSEDDFSWEWFSKESGSRFKKLLSGQPVEVEVMRLPLGEELVQVRFLEDTTLRFKPACAEKETHHIVIRAGSVLRFR